jgi:hypothetical protein
MAAMRSVKRFPWFGMASVLIFAAICIAWAVVVSPPRSQEQFGNPFDGLGNTTIVFALTRPLAAIGLLLGALSIGTREPLRGLVLPVVALHVLIALGYWVLTIRTWLGLP